MFQYNLYRRMQETYPDTQVKADLTWFYANDDHHGYELEKCFSHDLSAFSIEEASYGEILKLTGQLPNMSKKHGRAFERFRRYPNRILRIFTAEKRKPFILNRMIQEIPYEEIMHLDTSKDWYLIGFWVEECYYRDRTDKLQKELVFDQNYGEKNAALLQEMQEETSVSIHVRRGDYLTAYAGQFRDLGEDYYKKAVGRIMEACDSPRFYIFSDDSDFIRHAFNWLENKVIVDHNTGSDSFRDLQLMSSCRHNIIANSTFSAWAAILNRHPDHLTIYPSAYLAGEDSETKTLPGWIRI